MRPKFGSLGQEDPLEKEMINHSSILTWEIPWTEERGRLQSVGQQSQTRLSTHATWADRNFIHLFFCLFLTVSCAIE